MITFAGANATLKIDGTSMPSNVITGFAPGDIIDLTGVSYNFREFTQLQNWANNQLTIFSTGVGSPTYQLNLDPSASYFGDWVELSPDGRGGTDLQLVPVNSVQINIAESGNGYGTLSATVNGQIIPGMQGTVYCANDDLMPVPAGDYTVNYRTNAHSSGNADVLEFPSSQISYARNVQIHLGNTPGDSAGCIVFGDGYVPDASHYNAGSWTALASFMDSITSPNMNSAGYFAAPVPIKVNVSGVTSQPTLQIVPSSTTVSRGASDSIDFTVVGLTPSSPIIDKDINVYFQVTGTTATQSLITGATPVSHTDQGVALPPGCFKVTIVGSGQNNDPPGTADVAVTLNTAGVSTSNLTIKIVHYDGVSEETNLSTFNYDPSGQPLLTASVPATITIQSQSLQSQSVSDGYISGATVFADANGTGQLAANDASTTTDANGNFTLTGGTGPLIAFGGTDVSTGLAFKGQLEAPSGSNVIDPLTTLISGLQAAAGLTVAAAEQKVLAALGLPMGTDLTTLDPIAGAKGGNSVSAEAYAAGAKIIDTADAIASAFESSSISFIAAFGDAYVALESDIKTLASGQSLNLTDQNTITRLIDGVAQAEHVDASSFVSALSANIATSNAAIDQKLAQDGAGSSLITDVSSLQGAIQSSTFHLTTGVDTIDGGAGNNTIIATSNTATAGDHIDGGTGSSTLALQGPGTFNLTLPTTLANVETITAEEGQPAYSGSGGTLSAQNQIIVLRPGLNAIVDVEPDASLNPNNPKAATITIVGAANHDTINLASGNDVVTVGSGETVNLGTGSNTIIVNAQTIGAATVGGGTGQNTVDVTGGGTMTMGSNITDIAKVLLSPASAAYHFTANAISGLTITDNSTVTPDALIAGGAHQTLMGGGAGMVRFTGSSAGQDTFKDTAALFNHDSIAGFRDNGDVIDLSDVSPATLKPLGYVQTTGASGTLTVSDGVHTAAITLIGVYQASAFHSGPDAGLGTAITYHELLA